MSDDYERCEHGTHWRIEVNDFMRVLLTPRCWLQNDRYSPLWDAKLNELMERHHFKPEHTRHYAMLGTAKVWVSNHPYASFTYGKLRPRRITILRAMDKLRQDLQVTDPIENEIKALV